MKIIDIRDETKKLTWGCLKKGKVYQADDETIILKTDEDRYVELLGVAATGELHSCNGFRNGYDTRFVELDVDFIIKGVKND